MLGKLMTCLLAVLVGLSVFVMAGCESGAQTGAVIGALAGAGAGQVIGGDAEATLIGAAVGGAGGYMLGNESDKEQARAEREYLAEEMRYVTANIRNSNGSISQVRLKKYGVGYVGPRGEYYEQFPRQEQLRPVYGF